MKLTSREQRLAAVILGAGRASHSHLIHGGWRRGARGRLT